MTHKHRPALEAINSNKIEEYLIKYEMRKREKREMPKMWSQFDMPVIPQGFEQHAIEVRERHLSVDYDKLPGVIAQKLQDHKTVKINLDEDGIT